LWNNFLPQLFAVETSVVAVQMRRVRTFKWGERDTPSWLPAPKNQRSGEIVEQKNNIKNTLDWVEMWTKERLGQKVDRLRGGPPGPDRILVEPAGAFEHHDRPGAVLRVEDFLRLRGLLWTWEWMGMNETQWRKEMVVGVKD